MLHNEEQGLPRTDPSEARKAIGRGGLPARQVPERREGNGPPRDRSMKLGLPVGTGHLEGSGRFTEVMRDVLEVLEEVTQTIVSTARVAQLSRERTEQLEDLVQSIRKEMESLMQKLHRSGEAYCHRQR